MGQRYDLAEPLNVILQHLLWHLCWTFCYVDALCDRSFNAFNVHSVIDKNDPAIMELIPVSQLPLWKTPNIHYHATLDKGENTISVDLAKLLCDSIVKCNGEYIPEHYVDVCVGQRSQCEFAHLLFTKIRAEE